MSPELLLALIAGGSSLLATLAGGLIAFLTLRTQLRHEAREKERERKLSLRRDVYLQTVGEIGKVQLFLGSFSRQDADLSSLLGHLQEAPAALSRAQLVASEATFEALELFGDVLMFSMFDLLRLKLRVDHLRNEIAEQKQSIEHLKQRYTYVDAGLGTLAQDDVVRSPGQSELARLQGLIVAANERMERLTQRNVNITEELGRETLKATLEAQVEAGRVNLQMRREIELPLDEARYLGRLKARAERLRPRVDELYKDIDRIFEETESL